MAPPTAALINDGNVVVDPTPTPKTPFKSNVLHRSLHTSPPIVQSANGLHITLKHDSGKVQTLLDATGGAAVSCLGHGNARVKTAINKQQDEVSYVHSLFFATNAGEELGKELVRGTEGEMGACFIVCSGE
jgi:adenosylmethionine-8-amino-7-oxononanoate aminotransferase